MSTTKIRFMLLVTAAALVSGTGAHAQTPADYLPSCQIISPQVLVYQQEAEAIAHSPTIRFHGADPDGVPPEPVKYRYVLKAAQLADGSYASTRVAVNANLDRLLAFSDSAWSDWQPWPADPEDRAVTFVDLPEVDQQGETIYYLFALQVMDTVGAVSLQRDYGINVANFRVSEVWPRLTVFEPKLGEWQTIGSSGTDAVDIAAETYEFQWAANAHLYGGEIAAYRWGRNLADPDDPDDPGWAGPPGLDPENQTTGPLPLLSGIQTLTIQAEDNLGALTRLQLIFTVVPVPDPADQKQLLLVDDVYDQNSNAWPDETGLPRDRDEYRDQFWLDVLLGANGVAGFHFEDDVIDTENDQLAYRDLVQYRNVIWTSRFTAPSVNFVSQTFRRTGPPWDPALRYNWLEAYQRTVGNVFVVGSRSVDNFEPGTVYPVLPEADTGEIQLPLGDVIPLSGLLYPDRGLGVAMYDHVRPNGEIYGHPGESRAPACAGVKGVRIPIDFWLEHQIGQSPYPLFPEFPMETDEVIDWRDVDPAWAYDLTNPYVWGSDEFYDQDTVGRPEAWSPYECDGQPCVEPMLTAVSRYDWLQTNAGAAGYPDWPDGYYTPTELESICGELALTQGQDAAVTDRVVVGFLSHRHDQTKPSGEADVVWGFDPYRFDHDSMKNAIRWVLDSHFGVLMNPVR